MNTLQVLEEAKAMLPSSRGHKKIYDGQIVPASMPFAVDDDVDAFMKRLLKVSPDDMTILWSKIAKIVINELIQQTTDISNGNVHVAGVHKEIAEFLEGTCGNPLKFSSAMELVKKLASPLNMKSPYLIMVGFSVYMRHQHRKGEHYHART